MSLDSWKTEYYQVPADDPELQASSEEDLVLHCIKKWEGFSLSALRKHGIKRQFVTPNVVSDRQTGDRFPFDASTCALCVRHFGRTHPHTHHLCHSCPIVSCTGVSCTTYRPGVPSPYHQSLYNNGDPTPMLACLTETLMWLRNKK